MASRGADVMLDRIASESVREATGRGWDEWLEALDTAGAAEWSHKEIVAHLALTEGASDETKARYAFVYGDFRRLHRSGLIAAQYRAAEWRHKEIELAAHELLQLLDQTSA